MAGIGMSLAAPPSTTHSTVVSGPMESCFLILDGTETCPRLESFVRIPSRIQDDIARYKTWTLMTYLSTFPHYLCKASPGLEFGAAGCSKVLPAVHGQRRFKTSVAATRLDWVTALRA